MESSDPSSTESVSADSVKIENNETPQTQENQATTEILPRNEENNQHAAEDETLTKKKTNTICFLVFIDIINPILLLLVSITTLSIIGLVMELVFVVHVALTNKSQKKFRSIKTILLVELFFEVVILILTCLSETTIKNYNVIVKYIGLDFNNYVSKSPVFCLVSTILAIITSIISIALSKNININKSRSMHLIFFQSKIVQYVFDILYVCCLAFLGSATTSALYIPLLLYFADTSIMCAIRGRSYIPRGVRIILQCYGIFFSLFTIYQMSPIGIEHNFSKWIGWELIIPTEPASVIVFCEIFAYLNIQFLTLPVSKKEVPKQLSVARDFLIVISFICIYLYAMFYPNYLSLLWMICIFISVFFNFNTIRFFWFRVLVFIYTLSFYSISLTCYADFKITKSQLMLDFGLFQYRKDFTFLCIGSFVVALLSQIGRIIHISVGKSDAGDAAPNQEEEPYISTEQTNTQKQNGQQSAGAPNENHNKQGNINQATTNQVTTNQVTTNQVTTNQVITNQVTTDLGENEGLRIQPEQMQTQHQNQANKVSRFIESFKKYYYIILKYIKFLSIGAMSVIGILSGFYSGRYLFNIIFAVFLVIVILQLYYKVVFYFIQFIIGLLIITIFFFYSTSTSQISFQKMEESGLRPVQPYNLFTYTWTLSLIYLLAIFVNSQVKDVTPSFPYWVSVILWILSAIGHLVVVFDSHTSIFTFLLLFTAIYMLTSLFLGWKVSLFISRCCSSIFISIDLILKLFSHFDLLRNFIATLIPKSSILDIQEVSVPNFTIGVLAFSLYAGSIAFYGEEKTYNWLINNLVIKSRNIFRNFYFYICWIFILGFSMVNNYPSFLKFLLLLFFMFGNISAEFFRRLRPVLLLFCMLLLGSQICLQIFSYEDDSDKEIMLYVGIFFSNEDPSIQLRNNSIGWLLAFIFLSIINLRDEGPESLDAKFSNLLVIRIFDAFSSCLHHWLPVIVEISLCISTLLNPSLFGWLFFVILIFVAYKEKILARSALPVTIIVNLCFICQYLLWLGCPKFLFYFRLDGIINKWGRFIGIVEVTKKALISNCITMIIFTFYLQFTNIFVDYQEAYDGTPSIVREIVNIFTCYVFEIMFTLTVMTSSYIRSFAGLFFFIIGCSLLIATITFEYQPMKASNIMIWYTFFIIGSKIVSRLPVFTYEGIGNYVRRAFGVPFQGEMQSGEILWIVLFALQRFTIHLMKSELYKECKEKQMKHSAYKFIRSRQITVLEKIDQDIITAQHNLDLNQIKKNIDEFINQTKKNSLSLSLNMPTKPSKKDVIKNNGVDPKVNNNDDVIKLKKKNIFKKIFIFIIEFIINFLAQSTPLNSEPGINVLTLETLNILLKRFLRALDIGQVFSIDKREMDFLKELPPSFFWHFQSLVELRDYKIIKGKKRIQYFIQYILLFLRRIAGPLFYLVIIIYLFLKPYVFSVILMTFTMLFFVSLSIKGSPIFLRILLIIVMTILGLRDFSECLIMKDILEKANDTVFTQSMKINVLNLVGVQPKDGQTIEIFIFICGLFFVVDQIATTEAFRPSYYNKKLTHFLRGYPDEYCYGIINRPTNSLCLASNHVHAGDFFNLKKQRLGLLETSHSVWLLWINFISFVVLLICWNTWADTNDSTENITKKVNFSFNPLFVFILIIHVLFMYLNYFFILSYRYVGLYFSHILWLLYTLLMSFFYIPSISRTFPDSLQFYLVLRYFAHFIAGHKCLFGTKYVAFRYPNFEENYTRIYLFNSFTRVCPFAFEIQTLLIWISQETSVSLGNFFAIRDIKMQLEMLMSQKANPKNNNPYRRQKRFLISGCGIFWILVLLFGPLFFMVGYEGVSIINPPISGKLEIGFNFMPEIFTGYASIRPLTSEEHQVIADSKQTYYKSLIETKITTISVISFSQTSALNWNPSPYDLKKTLKLLKTDFNVVPYFRFKFIFEHPTSAGTTQDIVYQKNAEPLTKEQMNLLSDVIVNSESQKDSQNSTNTNTNTIIDIGLNLPSTLFMPAQQSMISLTEDVQNTALSFVNESNPYDKYWSINFKENLKLFSFLFSPDEYMCMLWSQPVQEGFLNSLSKSGGDSITGIYILLVLVLGEVIRERSLKQLEDLWIIRMKKPQKLYKLVVAIEAFRIAHEPEREKDMTDKLLDTLMSPDNVLKITADDN